MPPKKFTVAQAEKALMAHYGNVSQAAKALGVDHSTLWNRFKREPRLQEARMLAMESALDVAENSLLTAARNGEAWATCFLLKTIGKSRGFVERQEIASAPGNPFEVSIMGAVMGKGGGQE